MITKLNKKSVVLQNLSLQSGTASISYEELASLAKLQERLTDENDVNDFITRSANVPGSTEIASCVAKKYMDDPSLMDNLVVKTRFFLNLGYYFVPALSKAIDAIEEDITPVNEVCGMIPSLARDIAANFLNCAILRVGMVMAMFRTIPISVRCRLISQSTMPIRTKRFGYSSFR